MTALLPLCELFADVAAARFPGFLVFSNADANREWTGTPTVEFVETDATSETFLDGRFQQTRKLTCACRAQTQAEAVALAASLRSKIADFCVELERDKKIASWTLDDLGTLPDERGFVVGETFYGFVDFTVLTPISDYV